MFESFIDTFVLIFCLFANLSNIMLTLVYQPQFELQNVSVFFLYRFYYIANAVPILREVNERWYVLSVLTTAPPSPP